MTGYERIVILSILPTNSNWVERNIPEQVFDVCFWSTARLWLSTTI